MPKTDLKTIFKNGENFKFAHVDYSKPVNANRLVKIIEEMRAIMKRTEINWYKLEEVVCKV